MAHVCCRVLSCSVTNKQVCSNRSKQFSRVELDYGEKNYFLTLNPFIPIEDSKIIQKVEFTHPFYDIKTINAQKYLPDLQGVNNSYFCGSYFGYGFHEDGLSSGINVSNKL